MTLKKLICYFRKHEVTRCQIQSFISSAVSLKYMHSEYIPDSCFCHGIPNIHVLFCYLFSVLFYLLLVFFKMPGSTLLFCMYSWYLYVFAVSDNLVYLSVSHFSFDCSGCAYGDGCIWNYQFYFPDNIPSLTNTTAHLYLCFSANHFISLSSR